MLGSTIPLEAGFNGGNELADHIALEIVKEFTIKIVPGIFISLSFLLSLTLNFVNRSWENNGRQAIYAQL